MTVTIEFPPETEAWLSSLSQREGVPADELVRRIVDERQHSEASPAGPFEPGQDATAALLQSWIERDATNDPDEIRKAEEELAEFKRNMNAPRKEAGERLLFPEVD